MAMASSGRTGYSIREDRVDVRARRVAQERSEARALLSPSELEEEAAARADTPNELTVDMQSPRPNHEHWAGRGVLYVADDQGIFTGVPVSDMGDLQGVGCVTIGEFPGETPGEPEAPPTEAPVNVDVPYISGGTAVGDVLNCTMGNWEGVPTDYAYQWMSDGLSQLGTTDIYTITASDVGHSITCVVTATNAIGSTQAPPSNAIVVT
jgi:hypothetical protein